MKYKNPAIQQQRKKWLKVKAQGRRDLALYEYKKYKCLIMEEKHNAYNNKIDPNCPKRDIMKSFFVRQLLAWYLLNAAKKEERSQELIEYLNKKYLEIDINL